MKSSSFGDSFAWGAGISAFQTEGAYNTYGKGLSIWDEFSLKKGKIKNHENANTACNFYDLYYKDIFLLKKLNIKNFKFSISWPRIIPNGTGFLNMQGVDFYDRVIDLCLELDITPWITLYHWDLPLALEKKGGWTRRNIINWFSDYVEVCALKFGDRVKNWIVLNEPLAFTGVGHFLGYHAPGKKGMDNFLPSLHHAVLCQAEGARILKELCPSGIEVGTSFSFAHIEPYKQNVKDIIAAKKIDALYNRMFIEPSLGMGYPVNELPFLRAIEKYSFPGDEEKLKFQFDFIGVQAYTRELAKYSPFMPKIHANIVPAKKREVDVTEMKWENYPEALFHTLKQVGSYPGVKKIYVTENGAAFNDILINDNIYDFKRTEYIQKSIAGMLRAKNEGVNVQGYFVWSLLDNFEWAEGYSPRYGIVHVDFKTLQRTVKQSGEWYGDFISGKHSHKVPCI